MHAESALNLASPLDLAPQKTHHFATLELVPRAPSDPAEDLHHHERMSTDIGIRAEVQRIMGEYVRSAYSLRSASGGMVINYDRLMLRGAAARCLTCGNTRKQGKHRGEGAHPFASASAPPAPRVLIGEAGEPLNVTAPRRDVAQIVRGRANGHTAATSSRRDWRTTIAAKLGRLGQPYAGLLEQEAVIRIEQQSLKNRLKQIDQALGSETQRRQLGKEAREAWRREGISKRETNTKLAAEHYAIVRKADYATGVMLFALILVSCAADDQMYVTRQRGTIRELVAE